VNAVDKVHCHVTVLSSFKVVEHLFDIFIGEWSTISPFKLGIAFNTFISTVAILGATDA